MPHKRNPILSENLTGLARVIRSSSIPFMENVTLWHERDISHSSVERTIGPDTVVLTDFAINRMCMIIKNLVINEKMMLKNLDKTNGLYNSQRVMLNLIEFGNFSREEAYKIVQKIAMKSWKNNIDFKTLVKKEKNISDIIDCDKIDEIFDIKYHLKNINKVFNRVLNEK